MFRALLTIGLVQFLTMLFLLVRTKTLALILGPENVGVMAVIDRLLAVLTQTAALSLPFAVIRFLPPLWANDREAFSVMLRRMMNLLLILMLVATLVGLGITLGAPHLWGRRMVSYRGVLVIAFLTVPILGFAAFLQNAIAARFEHNRAMLFSLAHAMTLAAAALIGASWKGLPGFYAAYAVGGLGLLWLGARRARKGLEPAAGRMKLGLALPKLVWKFCLAMLSLAFLAPYAAWFVHYRVFSSFDAATAGWMQAAIGISLAVRAVLGSAHAVFLTPNVNREGTPGERMRWANEYQRTLFFIAGLTVPLVLLFPDLAVKLLYSKAFLPGRAFVALFILVELLALLAATYQSLVVAFDHYGFHVFQNVVAQVLMVLVAALLIDRYGILGAGIAGLSAQLALLTATMLFLSRTYGLRLPVRMVALAVLVATIVVVAGVVGVLFEAWSWSVVSGKTALYAIIVAALLVFLTPVERDKLVRVLRGLGGLAPSTG